MRRDDRIERAGWNPWRALHGPWLKAKVRFDDLPDGVDAVSCPYPGRPAIVIQRGLTQRERNVALAHELVHLERGGTCQAISWREERAVEDEVARRLVPLDELRRFVVDHERMGDHVHAWQVAEEWWVTEPVARRALELLLEQVRGALG